MNTVFPTSPYQKGCAKKAIFAALPKPRKVKLAKAAELHPFFAPNSTNFQLPVPRAEHQVAAATLGAGNATDAETQFQRNPDAIWPGGFL